MNKNLWSNHTTYELKKIIEEEDPIVIVTIGATEQHGTHLPINTDTDIGFNIAKKMAENSPKRCLVLPPIWTGLSPHHMDFSGTITLRQSTLFALTYDVIESLIVHGVNKIILMNSHGGNISLLKTVVDEIGVNHDVSLIYFTYWNLISDVIDEIRESKWGGMSHAGELETALKLYFSPEDVRKDKIEDVMLKSNEFFGNDMFYPSKIGLYKTFKSWSELGQIGAPSLATFENGKQIISKVIEKFNKLINTQWGEEKSK